MLIHYPATRLASHDIELFDLTGDPTTPGTKPTPEQANVGIGKLI